MVEVWVYLLVFLWAYVRYFHVARPDEESELEVVHPSILEQYSQLLHDKNPFFSKLNPEGKHHFIFRTREIELGLDIITREDFEVTTAMKRQICACIAQLTFGLKEPNISLLNGVVLYADIFYSRLLEKWVRGLTMGNGVVHLSWKHFEEGYQDSEDTYNLGLHEFAHMLRLQAERTGDSDTRVHAYFEDWEERGAEALHNMRNGKIDFLREYAATNPSEFFSVCIENFFEVPHKMSKELPTLYYHLCYLLNQNPLNVADNYSFNKEDADEVNTQLDDDVPVFTHVFSKDEQTFWTVTGHASLISFAAILLISNEAVKSLEPVIRCAIVSGSIMLAVRWWYYRDIRSITNTDYIVHFLTKVLPFIATIAFVLFLISA